MYSGSVASTGTASAGSTAPGFITVAQSTSRSPSSAVTWGRCRMTDQAGLWVANSIALSSIGLYGIVRLGSIPQDADTITLGVASSIRIASSFGAKPPKTTECTAPIRAQASIATTASGTI